jgi:uncharacterized Fe-S radical SAM superfamily protein PflX
MSDAEFPILNCSKFHHLEEVAQMFIYVQMYRSDLQYMHHNFNNSYNLLENYIKILNDS